MAPDRGHGQQFRIQHVGDFKLAVFRRKVEIGLTRHYISLCLDRAQCSLEVALLEFVVADVSVLPIPQHGEQVVGILLQKEAFPKPDEEIFQRGIAQALYIEPLAIEGLRDQPA